MPRPGGRDAWVDAARTLGCALVVLVHVNEYTRPPLRSWWPGGIQGAPLFALAVPLFMILAGMYADRARGAGLGPRLVRLLIPFFAWNAIMVAIWVAVGGTVTPGRIAFGMLTGQWQLYFLFALAQLVAIHWLLRRGPEPRAGRAAYVAAALATTLVYLGSDLLLWTVPGGSEADIERWIGRFGPTWALFFATGVLLSHRPELFEWIGRHVRPLTAVAVVSYAAYVAAAYAADARFGFAPRKQFLAAGLPFQAIGPVLLLAWLRRIDAQGAAPRPIAWLARTGRQTFGIYLAHAAVLMGLVAALGTTGLLDGGWREASALFVATWSVTLLAVVAWQRALAHVRSLRTPATHSP